jgi:hypothetical protein
LIFGNGAGTVVATDGVQINCTSGNPEHCLTDFYDAGGGGIFRLIATPASGSRFAGWTDCPSSDDTECTLSFNNSDLPIEFSVTATFDLESSGSCTAPTTIEDDFSVDRAWTTTVLDATGGATQSVLRASAGGNPSGGFREMTHTFGGAGSITVYHLFTAATYNPATQGAIDHLEVAEDQIVINPPFAGAGVGTGFVVSQGGVNYSVILRPPGGAFTSIAWSTTTRTLTAADFPGVNFSQTGGPITFGYFRSNTNNAGPLVVTHGIDNFSVQVCEP